LIWRSYCDFWSVFIKKHETLSLVDMIDAAAQAASAPQPQAAAAACLGA
jgi:hypothetical protein